MRPEGRWRRKLWNFEKTKIDRCPSDEWSAWLCTIAIQPALAEIGVSVSMLQYTFTLCFSRILNNQDFFQSLKLAYPSFTDSGYLLQIFHCCTGRLYEGTAGFRCALRRPSRWCNCARPALHFYLHWHCHCHHSLWFSTLSLKEIFALAHRGVPCMANLYLHWKMLQLTLPFVFAQALLTARLYLWGSNNICSWIIVTFIERELRFQLYFCSSPEIFSWIIETVAFKIGAFVHWKSPKCLCLFEFTHYSLAFANHNQDMVEDSWHFQT